MKATLTLEFDTPAALHAFVDRMRGKDVITVVTPPISDLIEVNATGDIVMKSRKPRNDAGKPRGPYKTTTTGEPAASEPGHAGNSVPTTPVAPATPTTTVSPDARVAEQRIVNPPEAGANPVGGPTLTLDDAKAALRRVKDTKGLGTQVCIALIQQFGFDRISDLPAAKFAEFIRQADEKVKAHGAKA